MRIFVVFSLYLDIVCAYFCIADCIDAFGTQKKGINETRNHTKEEVQMKTKYKKIMLFQE